MEIFILTFCIFALFSLGMSLGIMFNRPPVKGHCGGSGLRSNDEYVYGSAPPIDCCFDAEAKNNAGCGDCKCVE